MLLLGGFLLTIKLDRAAGFCEKAGAGNARPTRSEVAMDQKDINAEEWRKPENWSGPGWVSFYFSKKDTRTWVPKKIPWMGWTLNLGTPCGARWLLAFLVGLPLGVIVIFILTHGK
jgi:uncharacterized membrane protein